MGIGNSDVPEIWAILSRPPSDLEFDIIAHFFTLLSPTLETIQNYSLVIIRSTHWSLSLRWDQNGEPGSFIYSSAYV